MNTTFQMFHRQLGRITVGVLLAGLAAFAFALLAALLGFPGAVHSFNGVALSIAYVFAALFSLFLLMSLSAAVIRWLDRRSRPGR